MFRKKAQAAMEFLMTYGWAILVVLVAIGALAYFGVLSPDKFLPEKCIGSSGFDCMDKASINADANTVDFVIKNNLGHRIEVTNLEEATDCAGTPILNYTNSTGEYTLPTDVVRVNSGDTLIFTLGCPGGIDDGRFSSRITIPYTNKETSLSHKAVVSITGVAS